MDIKQITADFSVSAQISPDDVAQLHAAGVKTLICHRPENEAADQPALASIEAAANALGMQLHYQPVVHDTINARDVEDFERDMASSQTPVHAFCRSGLRSITLWSLLRIKQGEPVEAIIETASHHGFDFSKFKTRFANELAEFTASDTTSAAPDQQFSVLIVGAGAAGLAVASSLLKRDCRLDIAVIDPAQHHYYQPGFTMVGAGIFTPEMNKRTMKSLIPAGVTWLQAAVQRVHPDTNQVSLNDGRHIGYERLIICPGLVLHWEGIPGLKETLGKNGVTSNYHPELAPYTWELVQNLRQGTALFTQPPMPIKCAGAPQKALYLSCDHWQKQGRLEAIQAHFCNAGPALFGVKEYVPALQKYIERYQVQTHFQHTLVRIDGEKKTAWFRVAGPEGQTEEISLAFDMIHVCPPQIAPAFIRESGVADEAGWVDVDPATLRHKQFSNIWSLGDVCNAPNAKTAAAVRKQAPVVAANIIEDRRGQAGTYHYDGYGACPLTVERGKIVLAEFSYGGKLSPTLPRWLLEGTRPTRLAWFLKAKVMPFLYWKAMLKGREWMVKPEKAR